MKPAFRLDQHPRRPQPALGAPPAGYFEQLPSRVMARLPQGQADTAEGWQWLLTLPQIWRTSLAAGTLLAGFSISFWLSGLNGPAMSPAPLTTLDTVSRSEMVGYLLSSEARVETADLAELTAAHPSLTNGILQASEAEMTDALDAQPTDESVIL